MSPFKFNIEKRLLVLGALLLSTFTSNAADCWELANSDYICYSPQYCDQNRCSQGVFFPCGFQVIPFIGLQCFPTTYLGDRICKIYTSNPGSIDPPAEEFACYSVSYCKTGTLQCLLDPTKKACTAQTGLVGVFYNWVQAGGAICGTG